MQDGDHTEPSVSPNRGLNDLFAQHLRYDIEWYRSRVTATEDQLLASSPPNLAEIVQQYRQRVHILEERLAASDSALLETAAAVASGPSDQLVARYERVKGKYHRMKQLMDQRLQAMSLNSQALLEASIKIACGPRFVFHGVPTKSLVCSCFSSEEYSDQSFIRDLFTPYVLLLIKHNVSTTIVFHCSGKLAFVALQFFSTLDIAPIASPEEDQSLPATRTVLFSREDETKASMTLINLPFDRSGVVLKRFLSKEQTSTLKQPEPNSCLVVILDDQKTLELLL